MGIAAAVEAATACRAGDEAKLNEEGLDDVLDRVPGLGEAGGQRLDADRPTAVEVGDHRQIAPVHGVEAEAVDFEPVESAIGDARIDRVASRSMGEVAYT